MKKVFLMSLLLSGLSVGMIANAETADDVVAAVNSNTTDIASISADLNFDCSISEYSDDGEDTFAIDTGFFVECVAEQPGIYLSGTIVTAYQGDADAYTYEFYCVPEDGADGSMMFYENMGDNGWSVKNYRLTDDYDDIGSLTLAFVMNDTLNYELAPNLVSIDGADCYELTCSFEASEIDAFSEFANDQTDDSDSDELLQMADWILEGMQFNISCYVTADQYLPIAVHIDMNGSELSNLNGLLDLLSLFSGTDTIELNIDVMSLDCSIGYDESAEIAVPEDVKASIAISDSMEADDDIEASISNIVENFLQ